MPRESGHPAITENLVVTGSPAFAGDDDDDTEVDDPSKNHHALGDPFLRLQRASR
jgi:hypothetical protein